jgi:hypothetical protein
MPKPLKPVRQRDLIERLAEVLIQSGVTVEEAAAQFHRALLESALVEADGSQLQAAKRQKMPRNTLRNQMISLGLLPRPKPSAGTSSSSPQARDSASERFPSPAPGSTLTAEQLGSLQLDAFIQENDI